MRKIFPLALWALLSVPLFAGDIVETIVARVNNDIVTLSELNRRRELMRQELTQRLRGIELQGQIVEQEKVLLRDLIDSLLLVQKGKEVGVNVDTEFIKYQDKLRRESGMATMEDLEKAVTAEMSKVGKSFEDWKSDIKSEMVKRQVIGREVGSNIKISKDEIQKFYDENKSKLERPEMVFLREILIATEGKEGPALAEAEKRAEDAVARAKKGENFAELAQKVSESESAKNGGDIGGFEKGKLLAPAIETAVFALKKGGVTDVIRTKNGLLILKVEEHTQPGLPPIAEAEEFIQNELYVQKMQPSLRTYLTKLRHEAYLEIRPGYVDTGAPETLSSAHLIPIDVSPEELTTTVAGAKKGGGRKVYKPWTWIGPR